MNAVPPISASQIEQLCDACYTASTPAGGGAAVGPQSAGFRLLANGVVFPELDFECLCAAVTGTTRVLLLPGLNTIIDDDHFSLWAWCAELLLPPRAQLFAANQREIRNLFGLTVHTALASYRSPSTIQHHHAMCFAQSAHLALAYLSFPLLEAMTKRACSSFVGFDGRILSPFSVPRRDGSQRSYAPGPNKCSSLRDLLYLHRSVVASPQLLALIDKLRSYLTALDNTQDPFDLIYSWRNDSLHGSTNYQTIGGTLLSWSLLICLAEIEHDFEQRRQRALSGSQREAQSAARVGFRGPWSFYPPA